MCGDISLCVVHTSVIVHMHIFPFLVGSAVEEYDKLTSAGCILAPSVVWQLLQLCSSHSLEECQSSGTNCSSLALKLYKLVANISPSSVDSYAVFKVLLNHNHENG